MDTEKIRDLFKTVDSSAIVEVVAIVLVAWLIVFLSQRLLPRLANLFHSKKRLYTLALIPLIRLIVVVIALVMIVPIFIEPTLQNMVAALGALGLAIGFAIKDYVSSLIAGIVAIHEMPYRPGDWVTIDGIYGEVAHIGLRTVELVTPDDTVVAMPHEKIWQNAVLNANNGGPSLMCVAEFFLTPESNGLLVKEALEQVAFTSPYLQIHKPVVVTVNEETWGTRYRLKAYPVDPRQQFKFITDLSLRSKQRLLDLEVQFAKVETAKSH
ncbi:small-conductance mechanosensitive channel [Idiomarina fontislapidosi]|uniref:Small-conductance mechanosensitive channel n=1 Tax=Idiomarina fontislapidosi TaxID=263723 RepID=A0A432XSI2_9GAMM|nr:mechanosensitive ion channel domain-containing protein [Idiomarina fontislapidosi]PYE31364.1 small-conductance mechanosensitive channel [Idiomarina fontislapidosi]RUO51677.1 mechanosensitive ion channel protein MscS [Idiomarina fontislapidosi]